jgi:hypothetical protein
MTPEQANNPEMPQGGVLAGLPRTRPQRTSARREAARARAKSETASPASAGKQGQGESRAAAKAKPKTRASAKPKVTPKAAIAKKPIKRAAVKLRAPAKTEERAPKQGYEPEEEVELGNTVHPPSRGELMESVADIFGELAGLGANAGGRLLKDALSIFRRS